MSLSEDYEPEPPKKFYSCPNCLGDLLPREGRYGLFYGCENYPNCKFTCSEDEYAGVYWNISKGQNNEQERKEVTMTNAEKYKDIEERTKAFIKFCTGDCENCPFERYPSSHHCHFAWLEMDTTIANYEVARHEVIKQIEDQIRSIRQGNKPSHDELCKVLEKADDVLHNREY